MVLGPYLNNYNRLFVVIKEDGKYRTKSYPRYLMEQYLGRPLEANEDVHHKDGNPDNNDISNFEIKLHGEHQREHSLKAPTTIPYICTHCSKQFILSKEQRRKYMKYGENGKYYCSKRCAGIGSHKSS